MILNFIISQVPKLTSKCLPWKCENIATRVSSKAADCGIIIDNQIWLFFIIAMLTFIERQKRALKKFDPRTLCTKKPFGYRVIHHGYSLMSCPGLFAEMFKKLC